ncbi:MAG: DUF2849 domain-containing protein [Caulobacteraceae bacterium]|nr:DUF2849 domain-containing protein [Caulobacteraceae bacterium]
MKALTANRLLDGEVVFYDHGDWRERFIDAEIFADEAAAEAAEAHAKAEITKFVDPYLIEVSEEDGAFAPVSYRERVRAMGPTNKPGHGKQAAGGADIAILAGAHGAARSKGRVELIRRK